MKKNSLLIVIVLSLLSCNNNGTKNGMQPDSIVPVTPTTNSSGNSDRSKAGSTSITSGANSGEATDMNGNSTGTTTGSDTGMNGNRKQQ
ncbi:MAG TPA: hypothetical protein VM884_10945 [Flavisolibacter sp.]|jgi:hypothetical protein|nr:hypothetical protein [Flavisolibacter sp.]